MMLLEEVLVCGGVSFHSPCTSRVDEGARVRVTGRCSAELELELELILSQMTQKPMLRGEVDCARLHKKAKTGEGAW